MKNKSSLIWTVLSVAALCGIGVGLLTSEPEAPEVAPVYSQADGPAGNKSGWDEEMSAETTVERVSNGDPLPPKGKQLSSSQDGETVVLWKPESLKRSDNGYSFDVKTDLIKNLQVGQSVQISLPQVGDLTAKITQTNNRYGSNHVFSASIDDRNDIEKVTIVRGKNITFMTVATLDGTYGAQINNNTGEAQMWDESVARAFGANARDFINNTSGLATLPSTVN